MKIIFILLLHFGLASNSWASIEVFVNMPAGTAKVEENNGVSALEHKTDLFLGHFGLGFGVRAKAEMGFVGLGLMGELGWVGDTAERKTTVAGVTTSDRYRYESTRLLWGPTLTLGADSPLALEIEYYPLIRSEIVYSDDKAENPWRKGDRQTGDGWAVGLSFKISAFKLTALYRELSIKKADVAGTNVSFPTAQFSVPKTNEVSSSVGFSF